jgi:hypothetical protein
MILAIDPGTTVSGVVVLDEGRVHESHIMPNDQVIERIQWWTWPDVAIEMVASYGMPVGAEVFETVRWIGRFQQAFHAPDQVRFVYRKDVKMHLCGTMKAKDPNIRQALIDKLGPAGTKRAPGPTYGVKSHAWAALAVAVTAAETPRA